MKPKVCIDARMLYSSGIGTYLQNLLPKLEKVFSLILLVKTEERKWVEENLSCQTMELNTPIYTVLEQVFYPIRIPSCDLFWSPHYNVPIFPVRAKKKAVTIHDVCHLACPEFFPKWKRLFAFFLLRQAVSRSHLVVTDSEFSKQEIVKYLEVKEEKIAVVYCGVEKKTVGSSYTLKDFGIDQPFLLYVGNTKPHKNLSRLLEAFSLLPDGYTLVLVSPNKEPLVVFPRVKQFFNLEKERLDFLYSQAKLLVHPSLYEGFGLPPLEAMSLGCPVVAASSASLPEVCKEAAFYIDPYDVGSLYKGMKTVLENEELREKLIEAGKTREKFFSWDSSAKKLINLFESVVSL